MSAESPNHSHSQTRKHNGVITVSPQQVTDPTILDSVTGFINEVVPAAYNIPNDSKDQIQWAHFEQLDCDESTFSPNYECDKIIPPPIILVLGYTTGIQVWAIPANGEATKLLSWRHGSVRVLRILPPPSSVGRTIIDNFASKRPLIALCDSATPAPHFCALSFISLKTGEQVKLIKFKNPVLDVLANRHSVVVTFSEKIAIFDAFTLEDRLTVTTCYISPGIYPNPVGLGTRWLAYAEKKLIHARRSSGGNEGEGVQSYTATVLHAAKSLGRGLRELGETVASSITGTAPYKPCSSSSNSPQAGGQSDVLQKGIVTVLDIESQNIDTVEKTIQAEAVVAHFAAHTEAIVCLSFDPSGLLLLTADKRGHDFHLFRIHPHPGGPALAAVHHLYVLHRGDTTARVQDMCFSPDSRWVTVSTLRGTTHVFPITPYGGHVGVRTHATPHVVNKMSRFHRSAGLTAEGRSNSPVSLFEAPVNSIFPYHNPRLPPYPHPTVVHPLAQIRQPVSIQNTASVPQRTHQIRQRLGSASEDNTQVALRVCACFAAPRAWIDNLQQTRESGIVNKPQAKPVESVFIMSCHGTLVQYDLSPHHAASIAKERVCDDTPIELTVIAKAQWVLLRQPNAIDVQLPLSSSNLDFICRDVPTFKKEKPNHTDDRWLSQVEIVTHAGPHRRLWMGPQFTFKTYSTSSGSIIETQPIDVGRSKPVNMPVSTAYPILIESGSASSCEQSPKLLDTYQRTFEDAGGAGELQLKEDLADAMLESPGVRDAGGRCVIVSMKQHTTGVAKVVNPLGTVVTLQSDDESEVEVSEDVVIHENCDEALFRPVVAPKAVLFAESKNKTPSLLRRTLNKSPLYDNMQTKNLEPKTEITFKITNKNECNKNRKQEVKNKGRELSPNNKSKSRVEQTSLTTENKTKALKNNETKLLCDFSDTLSNMPDKFISVKDSENYKQAISISVPKSLDNLDFSVMPVKDKHDNPPQDNVDSFDFKFNSEDKLKKLEEDVFTCPILSESLTQLDKFEDARDTCSNKYENNDLNDKKCAKLAKKIKNEKETTEQISSSEETVPEEKPISRKPRKPKTKLGVRITNVNKENIENLDKKSSDISVEITLPALKKSWSSIAASKPKIEEKSILDQQEKETSPEVDFTIQLPKKSYSYAAKESLIVDTKNDTPAEGTEKSDEEILVKIDKVSDDEKQENTSSQTETTESDDSSKVPVETVAMDTEEDCCQRVESKNSHDIQNATKSSKRKSKKKRR